MGKKMWSVDVISVVASCAVSVAVPVAIEPPQLQFTSAVVNVVLVLAAYAMTLVLQMTDKRSATQTKVVMEVLGGASPAKVKERYGLNDRTLGVLWQLASRVYCGDPIPEVNCMPFIWWARGRAGEPMPS